MMTNNPPDGGLFTATVAAHELKTPTALVRQLALELRAQASDERERRLIDQIILTSERSLRLTGNLTKTARLGNTMVELEPVNAQQMCEEVAQEIWPLYKAHGRQLDVRMRKHAPLVIANRDLLRRVLLNFADNALYYGDDTSNVTLGVRRHGETVEIGLRDKGPVLPSRKNTLSTLTGRPSSSGIGLAISREFAGVMQSTVGTTRHRDGMTFYIAMKESSQLALL